MVTPAGTEVVPDAMEGDRPDVRTRGVHRGMHSRRTVDERALPQVRVSRKTGYKWWRGSTPVARGLRIAATCARIPMRPLKRSKRCWSTCGRRIHLGPRKLCAWFVASPARAASPSASTVGRLLAGRGCATAPRAASRRRPLARRAATIRRPTTSGGPTSKGASRSAHGRRCNPLTPHPMAYIGISCGAKAWGPMGERTGPSHLRIGPLRSRAAPAIRTTMVRP